MACRDCRPAGDPAAWSWVPGLSSPRKVALAWSRSVAAPLIPATVPVPDFSRQSPKAAHSGTRVTAPRPVPVLRGRTGGQEPSEVTPRASRSRSVNPGSWIPGTVPALEYCQTRHVGQPDGMAGLAAVV